jgi:hypothetical protein
LRIAAGDVAFGRIPVIPHASGNGENAQIAVMHGRLYERGISTEAV